MTIRMVMVEVPAVDIMMMKMAIMVRVDAVKEVEVMVLQVVVHAGDLVP